jgi:TonB family protein
LNPMNRLQKKCFIASAGVHLLLALILVVGPAFVARDHKPDTTPELNFIPYLTTDTDASGGGNANVHSAPPPAPAPPAPQQANPAPRPQQQAERPRDPTPPQQQIHETKPKPTEDPDSPVVTPKHRKIEINTKVVSRYPESKEDTKAKADQQAADDRQARAEAKAAADARNRIAQRFDQAANRVGNGISPGTEVKLEGLGGSGVPYANFLAAVKSVYTRAWILPDDVTDDDATVTATVTIARNGDVISSHIIHRSGNAAADHSVQLTLDRVTHAAPLPTNATEDQRTVTINFNVRAKRGLG